MNAAHAAALILCGLVGAVALAGCGEDTRSDEDYVNELSAVAVSFGDGVNELSREISELEKLDLKSAGELLQTFSDRVEDLAAKIEDVSPPEVVAELHARLVALLEDFGGKARQAAIALKAGDLLGGLPALTGFAAEAADVGARVDSTVSDIKAKLGVD
jgi:hypothetical protein